MVAIFLVCFKYNVGAHVVVILISTYYRTMTQMGDCIISVTWKDSQDIEILWNILVFLLCANT